MQSPDRTEIQWCSLMYYKPLNNICYFSNSISTGLKGNVRSSGLTYAIPLPIIIWHGTNDVLLSFSTNDTILVCPGSTLILFVAVKDIENLLYK